MDKTERLYRREVKHSQVLLVLGLVSVLAVWQGVLVSQEAPGAILRMQQMSAGQGWVLTDTELLFIGTRDELWLDFGAGPVFDGVSDASVVGERMWLAGVHRTRPDRMFVSSTIDAGRSWNERSVDESTLGVGEYSRAWIQFVDTTTGWLLGKLATSSAFSVGELLRTTDGGETWERLQSPPAAGRFVFADAQRGFMASAPISDRLFATYDGGDSWHELALPIDADPGMVLYDLPAVHGDGTSTVTVTVRGTAPALYVFVAGDGDGTWRLAGSRDLPTGYYYEPVPSLVTRSGELRAYGVRNSLVTPAADRGAEALSGTILTLADGGDDSIWALVASGGCDDGSCRRTWRLISVGEGAERSRPTTRELLNRSQEEIRTPASSERAPGDTRTRAIVSFGYGFDTCQAPAIEDMQTWKDDGPFMDANIYYGGAARTCWYQHNLNSEWVDAVFAQGWRLIPTWVGPQAPCWREGALAFSLDPRVAGEEGLAQATEAVHEARTLGLGVGTPLYYDMEKYAENRPDCSLAVRAFVDAWSQGVEERGYVAGIYGSPRNASADWREGVVDNPPTALWLAHWRCGEGLEVCLWDDGPTVRSEHLDDSYWGNNQRIRQYWGSHEETWGHVRLKIDRNYANGLVVAP